MACAQSTSINSNAPSLKASRRDKFSLTYMFTVGLSLQADGLAAQYSRAFKGELVLYVGAPSVTYRCSRCFSLIYGCYLHAIAD